MITSAYSKRCGSYWMYLESDSPPQTVMIVCKLKCFSHISNRHNKQTFMQSCDVFHNNTQYSLLLFIHVQVQCDLAITRNTCVYVCSLNCLDLFLKYKIDQTCCVCVCVCVYFGSKCQSFLLLRDVFERLKCCLDMCLSSILDYIHICVFLFFEKPFLSNLNSFSTAFDGQAIYRDTSAFSYHILNSS